MPDDRREDRTGATAGIEIIHDLGDDIELQPPATAWPRELAFDVPVRVRHVVGSVSPNGMRHAFDVGMRVSYYTAADGEGLVRIRNLDPAGPTHLLRLDPRGREYEVRYEFRPDQPTYRRDVEIAAFSHALTARGSGLMAHGCGVLLPGGSAAICLGHSGAGKSTAARMLDGVAGVSVINDDRMLVARRDGVLRAWGTPWPGTAGVARTGDGALGALVLIARGGERAARALAPREALPRLLSTLALPIWDRRLMDASLDFVGAMLGEVPVIELRYPLEPDTPAWMVEMIASARC